MSGGDGLGSNVPSWHATRGVLVMSAETLETRMVAYRLGQLKKEGFEKVQVPVGYCGKWKVERFVIDQEGASHHNMLEAIHGRRRMVMPGEYTRLCYGGEVVMSDTTAET